MTRFEKQLIRPGALVGRGVIVTGCSTGIGLALANLLSDQGAVVFAGVRSPDDRGSLSSRIIPLALDVRDESAVRAAATRVRDELSGAPLAGVVNNAAISQLGPIVAQPLTQVRDVFETNALGTVSVTRAFADLLHEGGGRVINIGSRAARHPARLNASYAASKAAADSFTIALRMELRHLGVPVISVIPGPTVSSLASKARAQLLALGDSDAFQASEIHARWRSEFLDRQDQVRREDPARACAVIFNALCVPAPRERYIVGFKEAVRYHAAWLPLASGVRRMALRAARTQGLGRAPSAT